MSSEYRAIVGAIIEFEIIKSTAEKTIRVCEQCGKDFTGNNRSKFCPSDGAQVIGKTVTIDNNLDDIYVLVNNYPELVRFEDHLQRCGEAELDGKFIAVSNGGYDHISLCDGDEYHKIDEAFITKCITECHKRNKEFFSACDSLGIKYEVKFGVTGYWW